MTAAYMQPAGLVVSQSSDGSSTYRIKRINWRTTLVLVGGVGIFAAGLWGGKPPPAPTPLWAILLGVAICGAILLVVGGLLFWLVFGVERLTIGPRGVIHERILPGWLPLSDTYQPSRISNPRWVNRFGRGIVQKSVTFDYDLATIRVLSEIEQDEASGVVAALIARGASK
jgi:hypothetical protein